MSQPLTMQLVAAQAVREMLRKALERTRPERQVGIVEWVESHIIISQSASELIHLDPWQREPLEFLAGDGDREVTVVAPEQVGKSEIWRLYLMYMLATDPSDTWIVYESDRKATDVNRTLIIPRMRHIPELAEELDRPQTYRQDAFYFPRATVHYSGAGAPVTSHAKRVAIGDEVDFWVSMTSDASQDRQSTRAARNVNNLVNLRKRTRTYRGRRRIINVSSPTLKSGPIWSAWRRGSQSRWCLACLQCGGQMRSSDVWRMQFEREDDGEPIEESIRLVCQDCGREHTEDESAAMNDTTNGAGWEVSAPGRLRGRSQHMSIQLGALACPRALSWLEIAEAVVDGGASGTLEQQKILDNSFRGLPLQKRKTKTDAESVLQDHCRPLPDSGEVCAMLFAADTQDDGWYCIHRAVDHAGNLHGLRGTFVPDLAGLEAEWDWRWEGMTAIAGIIDEGGHRAKQDVVPFVLDHPGLYSYKGETAIRELDGWRISDAKDRKKRLLLANPYHFQEQLLWLLYQHTDPNADGFWSLPPLEDEKLISGYHEDYAAQLGAMEANSRKKWGHEYRNWDSGGKPDHFFDAEKMWLVLLEYALKHIPPEFWRGKRLPEFYIERLRKEAQRRRRRR